MTRTAELVLGSIGVVTSLAMVAAVPWVVQHLHPDHFVRPRTNRPLWLTIMRNSVGVALIVVGVILLFLPGQGVLTILLGVSILDLPIKHRLTAYLLRKAPVREALQRMRARRGQPPLELPPVPAPAGATS
jgi:hypothetical protein